MPETTSELRKLSAVQLIDGFARRAFSPVEVLDDVLAHLDRVEPKLHAFLAIDRAGALAAARKAEALWMSAGDKPPLCGVPVSVKDTIEMAGMPTTYGSLAFRDNMRDDAELVRRLRNSGAVIFGKTNSPEFALRARTENRLGAPTANPWNPLRTAGGSSGGSASAVAAALGPVSIGTDSGGSIRLPAAYQGIFGIKPSHQRIPAVQNWRASPNRSHNGPITRTVRDAALTLQALSGPDPRDPESANYPMADFEQFSKVDVRGCKIGVSRTFGGRVATGTDMLRIVDEAVELLKAFGCRIVDADPPAMPGDNYLAPGVWAYSGDHFAAAEKLCPEFLEKHYDDLTDYAKPIYKAGREALAWQYRGILARDRQYQHTMAAWMSDYDFLLTPCCDAAPAITGGDPKSESRGEFGFLAPFNISRNPAAAVPWGVNAEDLPLSIQFVAPHGHDVELLGLCRLVEMARPWAHRWPDLS